VHWDVKLQLRTQCSVSVLDVCWLEWQTALCGGEWIEFTYVGLQKQTFCSVCTKRNIWIFTGLILDSVFNVSILHDKTPFSLVDMYVNVGGNCCVCLGVPWRCNLVRCENIWKNICVNMCAHKNRRFRMNELVTLTHVLHNANNMLADTLHVYISPLPLNDFPIPSMNTVPGRGFCVLFCMKAAYCHRGTSVVSSNCALSNWSFRYINCNTVTLTTHLKTYTYSYIRCMNVLNIFGTYFLIT